MENNLEILENIMKPYFDNNMSVDLQDEKVTFSIKIDETKESINQKIKELEIELENLRVNHKIATKDFKEKMDKEIGEYINQALNTNSNFFVGYGAMLRKDLEREYNKKLIELEESFKKNEESLIFKISELKSEIENDRDKKEDSDNLDNNNKINLIELVEIKVRIRKQLFEEQRRLNFELFQLESISSNKSFNDELQKEQSKYEEIYNKLCSFDIVYQVTHVAEWKKLYEEGNSSLKKIEELKEKIDQISNIKNALAKIDQYLKLTELTKEEASVASSMNLFEQSEEPQEKDQNIIVDDMENLLRTIYNDIVKEAMNLRIIKLNENEDELENGRYYISSKDKKDDYKLNGTVNMSEEDSIVLPCGEYLNYSDIDEAIGNLYTKNKETNKTYTVKLIGKKYEITKLTMVKLTYQLKKCSTIRLVKEKKIAKLDLLRVYGKKKADDIVKEVEIGEIKDSKLPEGDYINRDELIESLDNLFTTKKLEWLRNVFKNFRSEMFEFLNTDELGTVDADYEVLEDVKLNQK